MIDHGTIVAAGTPEELKRAVSGDAVTLTLTTGPDADERAARRSGLLGAPRAVQAPDAPTAAPGRSVRVPDGGAALPGLLRSLDARGIAPRRRRGPPPHPRRRLPDPHRPFAARARRRLTAPDPPEREPAVTFLRETWIVFSRAMRLSLRNPVWVVIGLTQPVLYLALFGPLLKQVVGSTPGLPPGDAWQIFVPGLLVQLGIFGAAFVGFGLIAEWRAGVIERCASRPRHRTALLAGRVARDVIVLVVQGACSAGRRPVRPARCPSAASLLALLVVALLAAAFSSLSYAAALVLKSEDALAPLLNGIAVPVLLLLRDPAADVAWRRRWLQHALRRQPAQARRRRRPGPLPRRPRTTSVAGWGLVWAFALVAVGLVVGRADLPA